MERMFPRETAYRSPAGIRSLVDRGVSGHRGEERERGMKEVKERDRERKNEATMHIRVSTDQLGVRCDTLYTYAKHIGGHG